MSEPNPQQARAAFTKRDRTRFRESYWRFGTNDCWPWQRLKYKHGYGQFYAQGKTRRAHRVAWILKYGSIPDGMGVLHSCDNPACVNTDHLFLGDQLVNMQDCVKKNRCNRIGHHNNQHETKTHCIRGHAFIGENVKSHHRNRTWRKCGECARIRRRLWEKKQREIQNAKR